MAVSIIGPKADVLQVFHAEDIKTSACRLSPKTVEYQTFQTCPLSSVGCCIIENCINSSVNTELQQHNHFIYFLGDPGLFVIHIIW